jgi:hypothetical protein
MVTSGNYRMVLTYFPAGDPFDMERVEVVFEYNAITDAAEPEAAVTTSSQPAAIQNTTFFQSTTDSFRVQVPEGWVIQDLNNIGSALLEETRQGYGMLAQICPQDQQQPTLPNGGGGDTFSCEGSENDVIHIVRYPDLDTRLQAGTNVTANNNTTNDNILSYHLQKLQEVGYRDIQIVNSSDMTLNLTNAQTNETIATVPAKLVEMTYGTNFAPNEIRRGYFISTATNATAPNLGTTKGYSVFYEGNSTTSAATATEITTAASGSLPLPLPPAVGQVFDSFELIAPPEVAQAADTEETDETNEEDDDTTTQNEDVDDTDSGDDGGNDSSTDANRPEAADTEEDSECGGVTVGGTSAADDYGCPPDPDD